MRISVRRSGGFAGGPPTEVSVDTGALSTDSAGRARDALAEARFFDAPANATEEAVGADLEHYEITVRDGARSHTVRFNDDGGPEATKWKRFVEVMSALR